MVLIGRRFQMVSSSLGLVWILLDILFVSLVTPILIIRYTEPGAQPVRFKRKALVFIALISGLPLLSFFLWDRFGIPPDVRGLYVGLFFVLTNVTPWFLVPISRYIQRARALGVTGAVAGFCLLAMGEVVTPPSFTL